MKKLEVLGTGCPKCEKLVQEVGKAARELGLEFELHKVKDIMKITSYGVLLTPALVVDEKVVIKGRVPSKEEIKKILPTPNNGKILALYNGIIKYLFNFFHLFKSFSLVASF